MKNNMYHWRKNNLKLWKTDFTNFVKKYSSGKNEAYTSVQVSLFEI